MVPMSANYFNYANEMQLTFFNINRSLKDNIPDVIEGVTSQI